MSIFSLEQYKREKTSSSAYVVIRTPTGDANLLEHPLLPSEGSADHRLFSRGYDVITAPLSQIGQSDRSRLAP